MSDASRQATVQACRTLQWLASLLNVGGVMRDFPGCFEESFRKKTDRDKNGMSTWGLPEPPKRITRAMQSLDLALSLALLARSSSYEA